MKTFIISRTDAIGDVVLTLPMAGVLKQLCADTRILFLGRAYTEEVVMASEHIDGFINWDECKDLSAFNADTIIHVFPDKDIARLAKKANIKERIGTTNRIYHWWTCNRLVKLSRRHSPLHEAQLNLQLLRPLGAAAQYSLEEIGQYYGLTRVAPLPAEVAAQIEPHRFNLVLHPKSRGSAREWGLDNFRELIRLLPQDHFKIFISGTAAEGELVRSLFDEFPSLTDLTGRLTLSQLVSFLSRADGLVAASTGPLHLAAAVGINAMGIYPPIRPMHPGRWAPIGAKAKVFVKEGECEDCRKTGNCHCIREIRAGMLKDYLLSLTSK
ncbi:MAG TPA: glycosyltransferase family 9 protein [Puia sp.]|uniref:glycosyltransferase family 9 protein n=1 Tax=Puia sp. TaxID=2045100 RepID=UPI002BA7C2B5|nr:glycosyltransferase family 9 protein [Puia sp.]HVU98771.1 glycosyltransferase family 9 protein [Puia sp.]